MKKPVSLITTFTLLFVLIACGFGEKNTKELKSSDFTTESALGLYEISVPKYMKNTTGLNADASMQFENTVKEVYLAIIDEDKADFLNAFNELGAFDKSMSTIGNYRDIQVDYFLERLKLINKGEVKKLNINGMPAEQIQFTGRANNVDLDIFYVMTFIEGQNELYMLMTWTLSDFEDKYKETLYAMAESFREI